MLFVLGQFIGIAAIAFTGPLLAKHPLFLALELLGVGIGLWAIYTMRKSQLRIVPEVGEKASLITEGPYHWVVHPMYTAVLLTTIALVFDSPSTFRWIVWIALLVVLLYKLRYEEGQLQEKFGSAYEFYSQPRKKLIPFIY